MHDPDLIIPVYLNQRVVFDLVAMLQDGIATVTKVVGPVIQLLPVAIFA